MEISETLDMQSRLSKICQKEKTTIHRVRFSQKCESKKPNKNNKNETESKSTKKTTNRNDLTLNRTQESVTESSDTTVERFAAETKTKTEKQIQARDKFV